MSGYGYNYNDGNYNPHQQDSYYHQEQQHQQQSYAYGDNGGGYIDPYEGDMVGGGGEYDVGNGADVGSSSMPYDPMRGNGGVDYTDYEAYHPERHPSHHHQGGYVIGMVGDDNVEEGDIIDPGEEELGDNVGEEEASGSFAGSGMDFDDPKIADLPRILLMGPRRAGKTSIQRVVFHKMSPHETLFRLEATQNLERSVVDHTPLCRFTIWDFPGDYYGSEAAYDNAMDNLNTLGAAGGGDQGNINGNAGWGNTNDAMSEIPKMARQPPIHGNSVDHMDSTEPNSDMVVNTQTNSSAQDDGDTYVFGRATALIFVLDAQDEPYDHVLQHFTKAVKRALSANPHIAIEVFINKVDGELFLSDEAKYDCRRDVMQQVTDELAYAGVAPDSVHVTYHLTSIYDHSVFEAFSRVVQKLIPQLPTLENLLNALVATCSMEKAYLFDVASKLYISTDSNPVDMQSVELCSDMIDVVLDVSGIYGLPGNDDEKDQPVLEDDGNDIDSSMVPSTTNQRGDNFSLHSADPSKRLADSGGDIVDPVTNLVINNNDGQSNFEDSAVLDYGNDGKDELVGTLISQGGVETIEESHTEGKGLEADSPYDSESESIIRLSKGMVLYLKEVDTMLALVCLTRSENFRKKNLINYNIGCLKKALKTLVQPDTESN